MESSNGTNRGPSSTKRAGSNPSNIVGGSTTWSSTLTKMRSSTFMELPSVVVPSLHVIRRLPAIDVEGPARDEVRIGPGEEDTGAPDIALRIAYALQRNACGPLPVRRALQLSGRL